MNIVTEDVHENPTFFDIINPNGGKLTVQLTKYIRYVNQMTVEIGASSEGTRWNEAVKIMKNMIATGASATSNDASATSTDAFTPQFGELLDLCDSYEMKRRNLDIAADIVMDPVARMAAIRGMSRSYSDNLISLGKHINHERSETTVMFKNLLNLAANVGAKYRDERSPSEIYLGASDVRPVRGVISTEIYIGLLLCLTRGDNKEKAFGLLNDAKDTILGAEKDTVQSIETATQKLSKYHPIQTMIYTPMALVKYDNPDGPPQRSEQASSPPQRSCNETPNAYSIALPQSKISIKYNIKPLIDRNQNIANIATGLNYNLIERLKTIVEQPAQQYSDQQPPRTIIHSDLIVSTNVDEIYKINAPDIPSRVSGHGASEQASSKWGPFAGCHPRVDQYNSLSECVILSKIKEDGWSTSIRKLYENAVSDEVVPNGVCNNDMLLSLLEKSFDSVYDANPPKNVEEFRELIAPSKPSPSSYLNIATFKMAHTVVEDRLLQMQVRPGAVKIPFNVASRTLRISQLVYATDVAKILLKRLKKNFVFYNHEAFTLPDMQKKILLSQVFMKIMAAAIGENELICFPPSIKLFSIMQESINGEELFGRRLM
jgi:hypothetical protein